MAPMLLLVSLIKKGTVKTNKPVQWRQFLDAFGEWKNKSMPLEPQRNLCERKAVVNKFNFLPPFAEKNENILPVVKLIPFSTNRGQ